MKSVRAITSLYHSLPNLLLCVSLFRLASKSSMALSSASVVASWAMCGQGIVWAPGPLETIILFRLGVISIPAFSAAFAAVLYALFLLLGFQEFLWRCISTSMVVTGSLFWVVAVAQNIFELYYLPPFNSRLLAASVVLLPLVLLHFKTDPRKALAKELLSGLFAAGAACLIFFTETEADTASLLSTQIDGSSIGIGLFVFAANIFESAFYAKSIAIENEKSIFLTKAVLNFFCAAVGCRFITPLPCFSTHQHRKDIVPIFLYIFVGILLEMTKYSLTINAAQLMGLLALLSIVFRSDISADFFKLKLFHRRVVIVCLGLALLSGRVIMWLLIAVSAHLFYWIAHFSPASYTSLGYSFDEKVYRFTLRDEMALVAPSSYLQRMKRLDAEEVIIDCRFMYANEFAANVKHFVRELNKTPNKKILVELPSSPVEGNFSSKIKQDFLMLSSLKLKI